VDDVLHALDVETPRRNVRGNQDRIVASAEPRNPINKIAICGFQAELGGYIYRHFGPFWLTENPKQDLTRV
jgi:hypothetical protein